MSANIKSQQSSNLWVFIKIRDTVIIKSKYKRQSKSISNGYR